MTDISIIVPVYNTKKFLKQCINSLLPSKKSNLKYEILLIDNNSTDGSLEECHKIAKRSQNIKVLTCTKPGAAAVRNFGLQKAKGKYIWFVDSDDYVKKDTTIELLKTSKRTDADAIMIMAEKVNENGAPYSGICAKMCAIDPKKDQNWHSTLVRVGLAPWQIVCKKKFLINNELFYDEGIIHEDMALLSSFTLYIDKFALCENSCYYYRQRKDSVLHQTKWSEKEFDIFTALKLLNKRFKKAEMFDKYKDDLEYFYIWNLLDDAARAFKRFPQGKIGFKKIRQTMRRDFPHWRRNKYFRQKPIMVRLRCYTAFYGIVW